MKRTPTQIPKASPANPTMAFPSPPASRRRALHGHPQKTKAPIIAKKPWKNRMMGAEPVRALNSLKIKAATSDPRTNPMISGLRYCTTSALCRPSAPAISRSMQATQMPILAGFPNFCRMGAKTPMKIPAETIPRREAKKDRRIDMIPLL